MIFDVSRGHIVINSSAHHPPLASAEPYVLAGHRFSSKDTQSHYYSTVHVVRGHMLLWEISRVTVSNILSDMC